MNRKRRLLIRLGSLGDVVLSTAVANAAMAKWGPRCLDVLVKAEWEGIWENHPAVHRRLGWAPEDRGPSGVLRLARRLAAAGYRATFDLQSSPRTRILTGLAGLRDVRRPPLYRKERRRLVHRHRGGPPPEYRVVESFLATLGPSLSSQPSVHPTPEARARARMLLPERGGLGLAPGARHATKRWPAERFVAVGREAAVHGPVAVFFGPEEDDLRRRWESLWPAGEGWVAIREPIPATAACLGRLDRLVTNDTGLMHLAAAVGTPVVALFGPTVRNFGFAPSGEGHRILEVSGLGCRPCSLHGGPRCPEGHFRCMLELEADTVREALAAAPLRGEEPGPASYPPAARTLTRET